jgi:hypothetical protein
MTKQKAVIAASLLFAVIVLVAGGYWVGRMRNAKDVVNLSKASASLGQGASGSGSSIALGDDGSSDDSGGLSVSSNGATPLGQLNNTSGQSGTGSSSGASGNTADQALNPATFGQYDKYKNESHALFGDVQKGTGDELTAGKKAAVYYKGWLTNGQLFDQSRPGTDGNLQPFVFSPGAHQVIPGWEEGLLGMKVGGTRLLIVPPAVGYGGAGQGPVPGNAVLIFEVQLAAVQ